MFQYHTVEKLLESQALNQYIFCLVQIIMFPLGETHAYPQCETHYASCGLKYDMLFNKLLLQHVINKNEFT